MLKNNITIIIITLFIFTQVSLFSYLIVNDNRSFVKTTDFVFIYFTKIINKTIRKRN